jgi:hypothetical protein
VYTLVLALGVGIGHAAQAYAVDQFSGDPVVAAVGDMACDPSDPNFNGGLGTATNCAEARVSAQMAAEPDIDGLLGLGDYQYTCGDPNDYLLSYTPTWGVMNTFMTPVAGNHEYQTGKDPFGATCPSANSTAQTYYSYFANSGSAWAGGGAHAASAGHFSFDVGSWHIIALNANCSKRNVGGCTTGTAQTNWLASDLAATSQPCILAYWHQPRWTGTGTNSSATSAWWSLLYQAGADLVLNGHIHNYQRFPLVNANGQPDPSGMREVIVGTGGENLGSFSSKAKPLATVRLKTFGYLRLVLHPSSYDGTFLEANGTIGDTFSGQCH